jgi:hypothetical protein
MSVIFRIAVVLVCAYAGWQSANARFSKLPQLQQSEVASHEALTK